MAGCQMHPKWLKKVILCSAEVTNKIFSKTHDFLTVYRCTQEQKIANILVPLTLLLNDNMHAI